jgi:hypothetical protein
MRPEYEREPITAATEALARAWNRLDPGVLVPWLSDRVRYESIDTELAIEGVGQVLSYLDRKVGLIQQAGAEARIRAELGYVVTAADPERPCVISSQGDLERAALFLVTVDREGLIERIEVCISDPDPTNAVGTGVVPS